MLVNLTIWCNAIELYLLRNEFTGGNILLSASTFIAIGGICTATGMAYKDYKKAAKEKDMLKRRLSTLLQPMVFQKLLELEPTINEEVPLDITLSNHLSGENRLLVITNPNCMNCAKIHPYIEELSSEFPISLIFVTYPADKAGKEIVETILTAYFDKGWNTAMQLLKEWFDKKTIKDIDKYQVTPEVEEIRNKQLIFCWKQNISQTPSVIIGRHRLPEVYPMSSLRYVLT